jgi:hypothetical protein
MRPFLPKVLLHLEGQATGCAALIVYHAPKRPGWNLPLGYRPKYPSGFRTPTWVGYSRLGARNAGQIHISHFLGPQSSRTREPRGASPLWPAILINVVRPKFTRAVLNSYEADVVKPLTCYF